MPHFKSGVGSFECRCSSKFDRRKLASHFPRLPSSDLPPAQQEVRAVAWLHSAIFVLHFRASRSPDLDLLVAVD